MIGLISAAPSLGQILQAFSPLLIERLQRRKPLILGSYSFGTLMWLPAAFIPFLFFEDIHAIMFMVFIMLSSAALALGNPARSSWFTDLVPGEIRGRYGISSEWVSRPIRLYERELSVNWESQAAIWQSMN